MGEAKRGVILLNLGGPESPEAVKPFLFNLFSDRLIIKLGPAFMQKTIAAVMSSMRAKKTIAMYGLIGGGSPIGEITRLQAAALEASLNSGAGTPWKVYIGMRYWHPFIAAALKSAQEDGIKELVALTLYPHYSLATTGSSFAELKRVVATTGISCRYVSSWPDYEPYVEALLKHIMEGLAGFGGECTHLLFSAHSLPAYFVKQGDPYIEQLQKTIDALMARLPGITSHISFQSRSGPVKWLGPSTGEKIRELASLGVKKLLAVPISFVSDHVETLYEIDIIYKEIAKKHGIMLSRSASLNADSAFIEALKGLVTERTY